VSRTRRAIADEACPASRPGTVRSATRRLVGAEEGRSSDAGACVLPCASRRAGARARRRRGADCFAPPSETRASRPPCVDSLEQLTAPVVGPLVLGPSANGSFASASRSSYRLGSFGSRLHAASQAYRARWSDWVGSSSIASFASRSAASSLFCLRRISARDRRWSPAVRGPRVPLPDPRVLAEPPVVALALDWIGQCRVRLAHAGEDPVDQFAHAVDSCPNRIRVPSPGEPHHGGMDRLDSGRRGHSENLVVVEPLELVFAPANLCLEPVDLRGRERRRTRRWPLVGVGGECGGVEVITAADAPSRTDPVGSCQSA